MELIRSIMAADWLIPPCDADKESLQSLKRTLQVAFTYIEHRPEIDVVVDEGPWRLVHRAAAARSRGVRARVGRQR